MSGQIKDLTNESTTPSSSDWLVTETTGGVDKKISFQNLSTAILSTINAEITNNACIFYADYMLAGDYDATEMIAGAVLTGTDGSALQAGQLVMRNYTSNKNYNGLWYINTVGSATRYTKCNTSHLIYRSYVIIRSAIYSGTVWECVTYPAIFGTNDIEYEERFFASQSVDITDTPTFNAIQLDTTPTGSEAEGRIAWNYIDQALEVGTAFTGVVTQLGQEMVLKAINKTTATVENGSIVYIDGATGNRPKMIKAKADSFATCKNTLAVATHSINNNDEGFCTAFGLVRGVNTDGMTAGDELWLSKDTAGAFTNSKPSDDYFQIRIGFVLYAHLNNGIILVTISNEYNKYGDIANGNYSEFEDDGTLKFNGDATVWEDENYDAFTAGGVSDPNLTIVDGSGVSLPAFPHNQTKSLQGGREVPHSYKNGTNIVLHVHFMPTTAPSNAETVKFSVEYYIKGGNTKIASSVAAATYTFATGALEAWREHRVDLATVTGTNITIGMQAMVKITRTNGDAGSYANPVVVSTFGYHYEKDTVGSRTITTK